jgi:hypothetical protein
MNRPSVRHAALAAVAALCLLAAVGCGSAGKTTASDGTCYIGNGTDPAMTHDFECESSGGTWKRNSQ